MHHSFVVLHGVCRVDVECCFRWTGRLETICKNFLTRTQKRMEIRKMDGNQTSERVELAFTLFVSLQCTLDTDS